MKQIYDLQGLLTELRPLKEKRLQVLWTVMCDSVTMDCTNEFFIVYYENGFNYVAEIDRDLALELEDVNGLTHSHYLLECQDYYKHYYDLDLSEVEEVFEEDEESDE